MEVLVCKLSMEKSIKNIMQEVMNEYFNDEVLENKIDEKMNFVKSNNFWYINSSEKVCTFIHKRGKKEGYMCHRKINTNIGDVKPDFLCSIHSKLHIPKKKER
jgi:hypothetical protein